MFDVKRLCWIAAWSIWLLLGIGLYRELPRDLGRQVRRVHLRTGEVNYGFAADSHELVVGVPESRTYRLIDARNGVERGPYTALRPFELGLRSWYRRAEDKDFNSFWRVWPISLIHVPDYWKFQVVESLSTHQRLCREWFRGGDPSGFVSSDVKVWSDHHGRIYGPPRPTWSVILVCQAILALPLIITWAAIRWRRYRTQRLLGAGALFETPVAHSQGSP